MAKYLDLNGLGIIAGKFKEIQPGKDGQDGKDGATYTPAVSSDGTLTWTNDQNLPNPDPVNIRGPQGPRGATGATGATGPQGPAGESAGDSIMYYDTEQDSGYKDPNNGEDIMRMSFYIDSHELDVTNGENYDYELFNINLTETYGYAEMKMAAVVPALTSVKVVDVDRSDETGAAYCVYLQPGQLEYLEGGTFELHIKLYTEEGNLHVAGILRYASTHSCYVQDGSFVTIHYQWQD